MTKSPEKVDKTKQAISLALLRLLEQKPLAKVTMNEVADEADVSRGTLYRYYDNIFSILFASTKHFYVGLNNEFKKLYDNVTTLEELHDLLYRDYLERAHVIKANPKLFTDVIKCRHMLVGTMEYKEFRAQTVAFRKRLVAAVQPDESRYAVSADLIAFYLLESAEQCALVWVEGGCVEPPENNARMAADADIALIRRLAF